MFRFENFFKNDPQQKGGEKSALLEREVVGTDEELQQEAQELEELNYQAESASLEEKTELLEKLYEHEAALEKLEVASGLSREEIISAYEQIQGNPDGIFETILEAIETYSRERKIDFSGKKISEIIKGEMGKMIGLFSVLNKKMATQLTAIAMTTLMMGPAAFAGGKENVFAEFETVSIGRESGDGSGGVVKARPQSGKLMKDSVQVPPKKKDPRIGKDSKVSGTVSGDVNVGVVKK
jgi:hypothetical protein